MFLKLKEFYITKLFKRTLITKFNTGKKVLIAPLDWGLGHATRCIPIIRLLLDSGFEVIIAAGNAPKALLQQEFPDVQCVDLPGYNIEYTKDKRLLPLKILWQAPKILINIYREQRWLQGFITTYQPDIVIADNRFGLYSKLVPCVFITHQLSILAPVKWIQVFIQKINYRCINRFTVCWVPDFEDANNNIAGQLSHPAIRPAIPVKYMGMLSRFKKDQPEISHKFKYLFLLSGPEPQRTLLEEKVMGVLPFIQEPCSIVRGLPAIQNTIEVPDNCVVYNHLATDALEQLILQSELVVCRSGYTSVMELVALHKMALLIPTPGQTEQEYLARNLQEQGWFATCNQDDDLLKAIHIALSKNYHLPRMQHHLFEESILTSVNTLIKQRLH
ncbi:glycosyltransferase [Panacibacter sp. KCS-6]|uniref:Glycosyltransferase n=1 Tax=Limnovirga soli TaxID=2656915 RepID=A0A8J8FCG6_9BACT|nr:glycosyltransferase [Limnovirga soli]